ncbi:MAG: hypothetical protein K8R79_06705 [Calditrichales bacterium]|nr:hypothetical protein [Calditrichales bacterium]
MIIVYNKEFNIREEYSESSLDFIKRSYEDYSNIEMDEAKYKDLSLLLTKAKYAGSRFENVEWVISVE